MIRVAVLTISDSAVALAFGLPGIFLGPVLLGIGYTLMNEWAGDEPQMPAADIRTTEHPALAPLRVPKPDRIDLPLVGPRDRE